MKKGILHKILAWNLLAFALLFGGSAYASQIGSQDYEIEISAYYTQIGSDESDLDLAWEMEPEPARKTPVNIELKSQLQLTKAFSAKSEILPNCNGQAGGCLIISHDLKSFASLLMTYRTINFHQVYNYGMVACASLAIQEGVCSVAARGDAMCSLFNNAVAGDSLIGDTFAVSRENDGNYRTRFLLIDNIIDQSTSQGGDLEVSTGREAVIKPDAILLSGVLSWNTGIPHAILARSRTSSILAGKSLFMAATTPVKNHLGSKMLTSAHYAVILPANFDFNCLIQSIS